MLFSLTLFSSTPLLAAFEPELLLNLVRDFEAITANTSKIDARATACQMALPELGRAMLASYICQRFQTLGANAFRIEANSGRHRSEIQRRLAASNVSLEETITGLEFFFTDQKRTVDRIMGLDQPTWDLRVPQSPAQACRYRVGPQSPPIQQIQFKNLMFLASPHFFNVSSEDRSKFRNQFMQRLKLADPDALLVEGVQIGRPIHCETVLEAVLSPEAEIINERDLAFRFAFMQRRSLIPADGQELTDLLIALFLSGDSGRAKALSADFAFVDTLQSYGILLQQNFNDPLEEAIRRTNAQNPLLDPPINPSSFRARYRELNQRDLPTALDTLRWDVAPSNFTPSPRGTNLLIDKQLEFRNKALLRAIQSSASTFQRPMAIYGSGHLADIGLTLEEKLGMPDKNDFHGSCPE